MFMKSWIMLKTPLQKLSFSITVIFCLTCILFTQHHYILGGGGIVLFLIIGRIWYRVLGEELMVSYLKRHGGLCLYATLRQGFLSQASSHTPHSNPNDTDKMITPVLKRLERKGIVTVTQHTVALVNPNQISTFEERMKRR